jgi:hypothetical protein
LIQNVLPYALTSISAAVFDALYGELGFNGVVSTKYQESGISQYTSSVEI